MENIVKLLINENLNQPIKYTIMKKVNTTPTKFKLIELKPTFQKSKRGLKIEIQPLTKRAIVTTDGNIVAYVPDYASDAQANGLLAIVTLNRTVVLPEY